MYLGFTPSQAVSQLIRLWNDKKTLIYKVYRPIGMTDQVISPYFIDGHSNKSVLRY